MGDRLVDYLRTLAPDLPDAPLFIADKVADQIDAFDGPLPGGTFPAEWYGKLAPPFPWFWVEADTWTEVPGLPIMRHQRASLVADITDRVTGLPDFEDKVIPGTEWVMAYWAFSRAGNSRKAVGYKGYAYICISKEGKMLSDPLKARIAMPPHANMLVDHPLLIWADPAPKGNASAGILNHAPFTWRTIGLLHERCEAEEIEPTRQQRRLFQREHKTDLEPLNHYLLKLKPYAPRPRDPLAGLCQPDKSPGRREHDVRATWAYYSPDKPLFGRPGLSGMFRRKSHKRGNDLLGEITKSYYVEPQEGESS